MFKSTTLLSSWTHRFISSSKIIELANAAKAKEQQQQKKIAPSSASLDILRKIDQNPSRSSRLSDSEISLLINDIRNIRNDESSDHWSYWSWYPPSSSISSLSAVTALSLVARNHNSKNNRRNKFNLSSLHYHRFVRPRLFRNNNMPDSSLCGKEAESSSSSLSLLQWLEAGLTGQQNMCLGVSSNDIDTIKKMMTLPQALHRGFSEFLRLVIEDVLNKNGITNHWCCGGTLLGVMRRERCAFIPHDDDVDLVVAPDDDEDLDAFDLRLRKALGLTAEGLEKGIRNYGNHSSWFAEPAPLFGYKIFAGDRFYRELYDEVMWHGTIDHYGDFNEQYVKLAPFGIFVDLFVLRKGKEGKVLELAYDDARSTWPREEWPLMNNTKKNLELTTIGEMFPNVEFIDDDSCIDDDEVLFPSCVQIPSSKEYCRQYLDNVFGTGTEEVASSSSWENEVVIPRSAHGKTLEKEVRFPMV